MRNLLWGIVAAAVGAAGTTVVEAHFRLVTPASWLVQNQLGDPQKLAPCGGTLADPGTPSGAVTDVRGGQMLRIEVNETIFHPGHYRIALARTRDGLPPDPEVTVQETERGPRSVSAAIDPNPRPPVLADGLWAHTERPTGPWVTEIAIPNIECRGCTLQIIEFMANHPGVREGGFSYHQCADLNITANPDLPLDTRW